MTDLIIGHWCLGQSPTPLPSLEVRGRAELKVAAL